jgi:hypothetical protein
MRLMMVVVGLVGVLAVADTLLNHAHYTHAAFRILTE